MGERYLVTGAYGCIGAWVVRQLIDEGDGVVAYDLGDDPRRLRLVMDAAALAEVARVRGDITDAEQLERVIDEHGVTRVIHLAALQVPFCQADPALGARVNVVGTINVFEAARARADRIGTVVYASSVAVYGQRTDPPPREPDDSGPPSTLYGVYKRANEASAQVYWRDWRLPSVGLRPHTVYGPGRDQGVTSSPTAAMLAAAAGEAYEIPYGGRLQLQYAPDVARAFVQASRSGHAGAAVSNLAGSVVAMRDVVAAIERAAPGARITFVDQALPFAGAVDASGLEELVGPLEEAGAEDGIADAVARFRALLEDGLLASHAAGH
jgi:nucleoside-diphosphate-sugar epimerase